MTVEQHQTEADLEGRSENAAIRSWYLVISEAVHTGTNSGLISIEPKRWGTAAKAVNEASPSEAFLIDQTLVHRLTEEERESHTPVVELMREGLELVLTRRAGLRGVAEWEAEHGALTEEELEAATTRLFGSDPGKVA